MGKDNSPSTKMTDSMVKKKLKSFDKTFKPYEKKLASYYGDDFAKLMIEQARMEYEQLLPQTPVFKGRTNIFNFVIGVNAVIVSLYKAMKANGKTSDEIACILFEVTEESQNAIPGVFRWVARKLLFSRLFLWISRRSAQRVYYHPEGWRIEYLKGDGESSDWYYQCTECGAIKYLKRHGAEELAQYCNYVDYIQSKAFGMGMQNPRNIGLGDDICCMYMKQGRETVMPENLKSLFDR